MFNPKNETKLTLKITINKKLSLDNELLVRTFILTNLQNTFRPNAVLL